MRAALLWHSKNLGIYSNSDVNTLIRGVDYDTGNLAFVSAIASHIADPVRYFPSDVAPDVLKKFADIVIIPCIAPLDDQTDLGDDAERLAEAGLPIVAIGLGAQSSSTSTDVTLKEGTLRWVNLIKARAASANPNVYARGEYTVDQLDKLGIDNAVLGACPSFFTDQRAKLGRRIWLDWRRRPLPRGISVAGGHQDWGRTRTIEHQLIAMMMDPVAPGQYVVQSADDMLKASRGAFDTIAETDLAGIQAHTVPHFTPEEFRNWCAIYARSFYDVPAWMDSLRRYDLTIGCRYHGVALALQAGRMGLSVTVDTGITELCENTGVPHIPADQLSEPLTRLSLKQLIRFDPEAYDALRSERAGRYVAFLEGNGLKPSKFLSRIAENR